MSARSFDQPARIDRLFQEARLERHGRGFTGCWLRQTSYQAGLCAGPAVGRREQNALSDRNVEIKTVLALVPRLPGTRFVIDDEIATGGTMVEIVRVLRKLGTQPSRWPAPTLIHRQRRLAPEPPERDRFRSSAPIRSMLRTPGNISISCMLCRELRVIGDAILCNHDGRSLGALFASGKATCRRIRRWDRIAGAVKTRRYHRNRQRICPLSEDGEGTKG